MDNMAELMRTRLSRPQYVGVLGQEYHLSSNAPRNLRLAASQVEKDLPELAAWLRHHADDEDGHHLWAEDDLADLGETIPPATDATRRLLTRVRQIASGDHAYRILGLSYVVEHTAPQIDPDELLPHDVGSANRFIVRHTKVDIKHAEEVDEAIAALPEALQAEVFEQAAEFRELFHAFLLAAAFGDAELAYADYGD